MSDHTIQNVSRRQFLQAGAGLTLGWLAPTSLALAASEVAGPGQAGSAAAMKPPISFEPNAFLRINPDNTVVVISKHLEMGQGTYTGLATLVAEELDADWSQIKVEGAPADARRYNNLLWGSAQGTGGSTAMANSWDQMRNAGATAKAMLVNAAAKAWNVSPDSVVVSNGVLSHPATKRQATFGQMAILASEQAVPTKVTLKTPDQFKLIGKNKLSRKDTKDKINGTAKFTQDVQLPGMLVAMVAHPPRFGATVKSLDSSASKAITGVVDVVQIPNGVAVLAKDTWTAKKGRDALNITWDETKAYKESSQDLMKRYQAMAKTPGLVARTDGNADDVLTQSKTDQIISSSFDFPFLAHAAMEPMDCVVQRTADGCTVWNGEQLHTGDQYALAGIFGIPVEKVSINMLYAGGSFGRRANKDSDYVKEAAHIVKAWGGSAPVKMVWTREDDMRAGYYRPMFHHTLEASVSKDGKINAWRHRLVGQSIMKGSAFEPAFVKNGVDFISVEGANTLPYAIPNLKVELHTPNDVGVPVLWWRSVGSSHTAYSTEVFLDQIAQQTKQDPVALRRSLLDKHPRHKAVLELVAEKAEWNKPLKPGKAGERRGRGVAVHESFRSYVAQVAEVTIKKDGSVKVDRVICAVDCGMAINPDNIRAQIEGGVGFALSAALHGEITLTNGHVDQGNFDGYMPLRINEMPVVQTHIVKSAEPPTGIGEPGVPPLAPAVANAIANATGKFLTAMPFKTELLKA